MGTLHTNGRVDFFVEMGKNSIKVGNRHPTKKLKGAILDGDKHPKAGL
jgi:hypothetical protein